MNCYQFFVLLHRYMKICYSSRTHFLMTAKASHIISMTTWFALLSIVTPYATLMQITHIRPLSQFRTCDNENIRALHSVIHAFQTISFLLVLFSLVFFYHSASRRVQQIQQRQLGSSNSKKLVKSRRNMLVLVSVFCICFVPYHLVRLPYVLLGGECSGVLYYLKEVTVLISVFNICLDPIIYIFLCKDFRAQLNLKQIFSAKGNTSTLEANDREDQLNTINTSAELLGQ
ncbi:hypothetical protein AMECASPLE_038149 [Ameca splendens]|uniref:G-protein coupled receptors family 1 profile domain-containing protein n=1 Tax=Ameca splendens TaxID=208324 RepID=A0ABV0XL49_9TELE